MTSNSGYDAPIPNAFNVYSALTKGSFNLSSGKHSTYYFDSDLMTMSPVGSFEVGRYFFRMIKETCAEAVGGVAVGGIPVVTAITLTSYNYGSPLPSFYVRNMPKAHGKENVIGGNFPSSPVTPVVMVDDVLTTGSSLLRAIKVVEGLGCKVEAAMCVFDRNEGGREALKMHGYELRAMYTMKDGEIRFNPY